MALAKTLATLKQAYQEAKERMPKDTKAIVFLSNIKELDSLEKIAFNNAIESLIESVEDWAYTFTLFGQTGFYSHCAINPHTITDAGLDSILENLIGDPEKVNIEYYR